MIFRRHHPTIFIYPTNLEHASWKFHDGIRDGIFADSKIKESVRRRGGGKGTNIATTRRQNRFSTQPILPSLLSLSSKSLEKESTKLADNRWQKCRSIRQPIYIRDIYGRLTILSAEPLRTVSKTSIAEEEGEKIATDDQEDGAYLCEKPGTRNFYFFPPPPPPLL